MSASLLARLQALADEATDESDRSVYRAQWAGAMARLGHIDKARAQIQDLRLINTAYTPRLTGWILIAEGLADHFESLSVRALDRFKRAHGMAVAFGDADLWSFASAWMGASEFLTGDYESAAKHASEAIQKAPETAWLALSRAHLVLANVLYAIGQHKKAAFQYAKARHFAIEAHDISMQSAVLYNVAAFHIARISLEDAFSPPVSADDLELAELELNSVANLDCGIGIDSLSAMVPILRAQLLLAKRHWKEADLLYCAALPDAVTYGPSRWEPRFLAEQAHCHAMLGKRASAMDLASRAIRQLTAQIEIDDVAACHARVASCLSVLGDHVGAETHSKIGRECLAQFATRQATQRERIGPLIPSTKE